MQQLQILWVSKSHAGRKAGVKPHSHPYYHMFHVLAGECCFTADKHSYNLTPGQTLLVPRQVEHGYTNEKDEIAEFMEIKFSLPKDATDHQLLQSNIRVSDSPLVGLLFQQVIKEYSMMGSLAETSSAAYLTALLNAWTESERYNKPRQFQYVDASSFSELSQDIVRYLEAHYAEDISLDTLAQALGYNKSYLCVAFRKNTHFTILDCLNMIRIRRAAELIVYSDHSLAQVSDMCGYASVSHFNRVFLKYVGITPGQCRRAYPADILFGSFQHEEESKHPNRFIYSALAHKRITPEMLQTLSVSDKDKADN